MGPDLPPRCCYPPPKNPKTKVVNDFNYRRVSPHFGFPLQSPRRTEFARAKSKCRDRMWSERASQGQSMDIHKTLYGCRGRKKRKTTEQINDDASLWLRRPRAVIAGGLGQAARRGRPFLCAVVRFYARDSGAARPALFHTFAFPFCPISTVVAAEAPAACGRLTPGRGANSQYKFRSNIHKFAVTFLMSAQQIAISLQASEEHASRGRRRAGWGRRWGAARLR
ncbi:hypothetical protein EVAR_77367_1 [Eumeta japonica]|uniref:Uncharacterized protein n=1 Tax=Eumeta variegata TaxID=151549 RepID=A0A4C1UYN9_EUMVA|nr:hypothetical protein EVAR_77367_1 [Eumeta japonica]